MIHCGLAHASFIKERADSNDTIIQMHCDAENICVAQLSAQNVHINDRFILL